MNHEKIGIGTFVQIYTGDKIVFGRSQRTYFLQGNPDYARPIPQEQLEKKDDQKKVNDVITKVLLFFFQIGARKRIFQQFFHKYPSLPIFF